MEMRSQDFDSVALFNQALEAHNAGDLTAAEQIYKETLAIQPDHCEANHNIGIVLVAKNELDKALEFFKLALTASPNVSLFWASYIDTLAKLERIIEAKALIKAARNSGMSCENIEAISQRLDIENQEPLAKDTHEIDEFITQQKFDDAIGACLNLLETYPSSAILNITLGKCYFELGQIDLAISSYTKATEYWPQSEVSYAMLGQIYSSQGDTEQAIKNLSKAVELKPDDHELHSLLGVELKRYNIAVNSFTQALKIKPDYAEAYNGIGTVFMKKGDYADACFNTELTLDEMGNIAIENQEPDTKERHQFSKPIGYHGQRFPKIGCEQKKISNDEIGTLDKAEKTLFDPDMASNMIATIGNFYKKRSKDIIKVAAEGWFFASSFDEKFICSKSPDNVTTNTSNAVTQENIGVRATSSELGLNVNQTIKYLVQSDNLIDRFSKLKSLIKSNNVHLINDSFVQYVDTDMSVVQEQTFQTEGFNIVIIGAGATGLFLASIIKSGLGEAVNVLVLDNRSKKKNTREIFSRNWLTQIPFPIVQKLTPKNVKELFSCFGNNGLIGIPINHRNYFNAVLQRSRC